MVSDRKYELRSNEQNGLSLRIFYCTILALLSCITEEWNVCDRRQLLLFFLSIVVSIKFIRWFLLSVLLFKFKFWLDFFCTQNTHCCLFLKKNHSLYWWSLVPCLDSSKWCVIRQIHDYTLMWRPVEHVKNFKRAVSSSDFRVKFNYRGQPQYCSCLFLKLRYSKRSTDKIQFKF